MLGKTMSPYANFPSECHLTNFEHKRTQKLLTNGYLLILAAPPSTTFLNFIHFPLIQFVINARQYTTKGGFRQLKKKLFSSVASEASWIGQEQYKS